MYPLGIKDILLHNFNSIITTKSKKSPIMLLNIQFICKFLSIVSKLSFKEFFFGRFNQISDPSSDCFIYIHIYIWVSFYLELSLKCDWLIDWLFWCILLEEVSKLSVWLLPHSEFVSLFSFFNLFHYPMYFLWDLWLIVCFFQVEHDWQEYFIGDNVYSILHHMSSILPSLIIWLK